jgi:hypothetical protein
LTTIMAVSTAPLKIAWHYNAEGPRAIVMSTVVTVVYGLLADCLAVKRFKISRPVRSYPTSLAEHRLSYSLHSSKGSQSARRISREREQRSRTIGS